MEIELTVNGRRQRVQLEPRQLLVYMLREQLGLIGTRVGCDTSSCGACTVLLNGQSVKSCTMFAAQAQGQEITTVEGLADGEDLHPIQQAFHDHHGLQCGYCTPGMMMAALSLIQEEATLGPDEIRRGLEGNICRCTGYQGIVRAVEAAREAMTKTSERQ